MLREIAVGLLVIFLIPITIAKPATENGTDVQEECLQEIKDDITWPQTKIGKFAIISCPNGQQGYASRYCRKLPPHNARGRAPAKWDRNVNLTECIKIVNKTKHLEESDERSLSTLLLQSLLEDLNNTTSVSNASSMTSQKLNSSVSKLEEFVNFLMQFNQSNEFLKKEENARTLINTGSNLLDLAYAEMWLHLQKDDFSNPVRNLVKTLDDIGAMVANASANANTPTNDPVVVECKNLAIKMNVVDPGIENSVNFNYHNSSISLPSEMFSTTEPSIEVTIMYLTLSKLLKLPLRNSVDGNKKFNETLNVTSMIVSSTVTPRRKSALWKSFVKIVLPDEKKLNKSTMPICVSWNPESRDASWTTEGCHVIYDETDLDKTTCACNHLTLFSSLIDPHGILIPGVHHKILDFISLIGCSVSLIAVFVTFATIRWQWNRLKSIRMEVVINLCAAIGVVSFLVLVEQPARKNPVACKFLSILLHYWLLSAFSWMFNEGLLLYLMVVKIDMTGLEKNIKKPLYVFGWGFPSLLLAISLFATELRGYGDPPNICWLSVGNSLIWAFVAPALVVIVFNIFILVKIIMRIKKSQRLRTNRTPDHIKSAVRAAIVTMPLLGVTWVFGLMTFHTDLTAIKYIFTIFNSFQGVFIFVFHCLLDRQVRKAIKLSRIRRKQRKKTAPIPTIEVKPCVIYKKKELNRIGERRKACIDNAIIDV